MSSAAPPGTLLGVMRGLTACEWLDRVEPGDATITSAGIHRSLGSLVGIGLVHRLDNTRSIVAGDLRSTLTPGNF